MSEPTTGGIQQALTDYVSRFSDEILAVLSVPHFPLLHATLREPVLFDLEFDTDFSQRKLRDQFRLISAKVTTPEEYLGRVRCTPACAHPRSSERYCPARPSTSNEQYHGPTLDNYARDDAAQRRGLTPDQQARLPAKFRLACTADAFIGPRRFSVTRFDSIQLDGVSRSALDVGNLGLPFFEPLRAILAGPRIKDAPDGFYATHALVRESSKNPAWRDRAKRAHALSCEAHNERLQETMMKTWRRSSKPSEDSMMQFVLMEAEFAFLFNQPEDVEWGPVV